MDRNILLREIEILPSHIVDEVYNYVGYLKTTKLQKKVDNITLASEAALVKDWLLPEEDAAWASL